MGRFAALTKIGLTIWGARIGSGFLFVIQKEKRQSGLFYFRLQIAYRKNIVDATLYFVPDPKKISGRPDKLDIRVQIDWAMGKCALFAKGA